MKKILEKAANAVTDDICPSGDKYLCGKGFECLTNKKHGFTLAEILISLLILGVIASLTIPSLIQNTQKKEEVVKIKKGLSVLSQAFTTNYALTGKNLSELCQGDIFQDPDFFDSNDFVDMLKQRLSIVDIYQHSNVVDFITQDGLGYRLALRESRDYDEIVGSIYTKFNGTDAKTAFNDILCGDFDHGMFTGCYDIKCTTYYCQGSDYTIKLLNAKDPTKCKWDEGVVTCD